MGQPVPLSAANPGETSAIKVGSKWAEGAAQGPLATLPTPVLPAALPVAAHGSTLKQIWSLGFRAHEIHV